MINLSVEDIIVYEFFVRLFIYNIIVTKFFNNVAAVIARVSKATLNSLKGKRDLTQMQLIFQPC